MEIITDHLKEKILQRLGEELSDVMKASDKNYKYDIKFNIKRLKKKLFGKEEQFLNSTHLDMYIDKFFMVNCPSSHSVSEVHEQVYKLLHQIMIIRHFIAEPKVLERDLNKAEIKNPNELPKIKNIDETTGTRHKRHYPLRSRVRSNSPNQRIYGRRSDYGTLQDSGDQLSLQSKRGMRLHTFEDEMTQRDPILKYRIKAQGYSVDK